MSLSGHHTPRNLPNESLSFGAAKCTRLDDFNPADAEAFTNMARNLAPMVDRIIELLPLYLAISKQPQGAYRLLVMVSCSIRLHMCIGSNLGLAFTAFHVQGTA